ncbi:hypothetical protein R3P38DRAFT_2816716 [Favolaschia claudopus]|uniref:Uncharacterized protein n=1 Tax=Favolaschia claudopus TaxID=2862362 RepID=A0AAV9YYG5_9AGAR
MVLTWSNTAIEAVRNAQGNAKARMLSFGKETVDQAIQQGNARNVKEITGDRMNRATYSSGQGNGQQHIKKYDSRQSTQAAYFDFYKTTPHQANLYHRKDIRLSSYKEQRCLIVHTTILPGNWAPNSMQRVPKRGEFGATTTAWEGIGATPKKRLQNRGNRGQQLESGATRILPELSE